MNILKIYARDNYCFFNRTIAGEVGRDAALMLGELCSEYNYYESQGRLVDGEWFYSTVENVEKMTTMSKHDQLVATKRLVEKGWIEKQVMGLPAKRYFRIRIDALEKWLLENDQDQVGVQMEDNSCTQEDHIGIQIEDSRCSRIDQLGVSGSDGNINKYNNNTKIVINNNNKEIDKLDESQSDKSKDKYPVDIDQEKKILETINLNLLHLDRYDRNRIQDIYRFIDGLKKEYSVDLDNREILRYLNNYRKGNQTMEIAKQFPGIEQVVYHLNSNLV